MSLKQGISLTIRNVVVALTFGVLFASTNALAAQGPDGLVAMNVETYNKVDQRELICLATNIYHEAGGESNKGKAAVAHVTLNRTNSPLYPNKICGVVYQKTGRACQFSWTCDRRPNSVPHKDRNRSWKDSLHIAMLVLEGIVKDPTHGALFFHEKSVKTGWGRHFVRTAFIGNHVFYKRG